jgi:hypothetical protein
VLRIAICCRAALCAHEQHVSRAVQARSCIRAALRTCVAHAIEDAARYALLLKDPIVSVQRREPTKPEPRRYRQPERALAVAYHEAGHCCRFGWPWRRCARRLVWQVSRKSPPAHSLVGCLAIGCTARTKLRLAVTLRSSSPSSKHIEAVCSTAASQQSLALRWLNNAPVFARRPNHEWPARFVGFSPAWREGLRPAALSLLHFQSVRRGCTSRRAIAAGCATLALRGGLAPPATGQPVRGACADRRPAVLAGRREIAASTSPQ